MQYVTRSQVNDKHSFVLVTMFSPLKMKKINKTFGCREDFRFNSIDVHEAHFLKVTYNICVSYVEYRSVGENSWLSEHP